jgi:hypothetical protein
MDTANLVGQINERVREQRKERKTHAELDVLADMPDGRQVNHSQIGVVCDEDLAQRGAQPRQVHCL